MATIYIDNQPYQVKDGQNLLQACLGLGFDVPYFCWHPVMHSVGACRQCAVKLFKDESDSRGRIVMSCMTPAREGTRISIDDPDVREFRAAVIEWLMTSHPHDCPVCDEGGECHLQDMTVMTGHAYRRYRFPKRTHRNQDLGPFVTHEMNRCIQCYRCVRFYRDYAGGRDLGVLSWHDNVYFGRARDGTLENEFSGNLVEICPTGVFTDKTLAAHYTRKWDLQTSPSICVHCSVGCNTIPGERYGTLRRIRARYNAQVNRYFLCDRGRYGYEFVNSPRRIRWATLKGPDGSHAPIAKTQALEAATAMLRPGKAVGIGSARASLEANFALRELVGPERFFWGVSAVQSHLASVMVDILRSGVAHSPNLHEVELSDAALVLGEDVNNTAPMVALALRQAVRQKPISEAARSLHIPIWDDGAMRVAIQQERGPLFVATPAATRLDDIATGAWRLAPDDVARLGLAVAHAICPDAPEPPGLAAELLAKAQKIAQALCEARRPLVVSGSACASEAVIQAAANVTRALKGRGKGSQLCLVAPDCNSLGLAMMAPKALSEVPGALGDGSANTLIVLECELHRHAEAPWVDALLAAARHVIVIDHLHTATAARADLVLPAATFAESDGTLVSVEGRAQRFYKTFVPAGDVQESWRWAQLLGGSTAWTDLDDVSSALARALSAFAPITEIAPTASFRINGQRIPRQPHRYSGRAATSAHVDVNEPRPVQDVDSPLAFSMEGCEGQPPTALLSQFWAPGWNSIQSVNKFQSEIGGPLHGGEGGKRLLEPARTEGISYFRDPIPAFEPPAGQWLIVPAHHIFGSEELSVHTAGIAQLAPSPYVAICAQDAASLRLAEGQEALVTIGPQMNRLRLQIRPELPRGLALMPVGLADLPFAALPAWGRIAPAPQEGTRS